MSRAADKRSVVLLDSWRVWRVAGDGPHPKTQKTRLFCRVFFLGSWRADLNRRPADYESAALPAELRQHYFIILHNFHEIINQHDRNHLSHAITHHLFGSSLNSSGATAVFRIRRFSISTKTENAIAKYMYPFETCC